MIQFDVQHEGAVTVVSIRGSLDTLTAEEATKYLSEQISQGECRLVLDLEELEYISSAGLRVLLATIKETRNAGGDLRLAQAGTQVLETMEMAGFTSIIKYYDEIESAVASFAD